MMTQQIGRAKLTQRQKAILDYITRTIQQKGYPPTLREIASHMGIRSTNGVYDHIKALERKGYLTREESKSRALRPVELRGRTVTIPVVGRIAAGVPLLAEENVEDHVQIDSFFIDPDRRVFALRVVGDSMIGDGILDGDYIFVKKQIVANSGEIVVALIDSEATVKRYYPEGDVIRLQPSNPDMKPILVHRSDFRDTQILGVVVGVFRKM